MSFYISTWTKETATTDGQTFSREETDVLVREVQAQSGRINGNANRPPRTDEAEVLWEEVIVNQVCPDTL